MRSRFVSKWTLSIVLLFTAGAPAFATITMSPSSVGFASQTVGTTSAPIGVTLTNLNSDSIEIVRVSCSLPQFSYSGPSLPIMLPVGHSFAGKVTFRPASVQTYSGSLIFTRANGSTVTVPLSGAGIQTSSSVAPSISAQPATQSVMAGQTATFSVTAAGTAPLSYQWKKSGAAIIGATSSSYTTPATSTSDNGAAFTVAVGNSVGSVTSNAATLTVMTPGQLSASVSSLNFVNVTAGSSGTQSLTVANSGGSNVSISNVAISGAGFSVNGISNGLILSSGASATMNVIFAPSASGSVTGGVTITSNASNPTLAISLSGTGVAATHSAALTWTASNSVVAGYNVYRSSISGGPYTKLTPSLVASTAFTDASVSAGQTYYYVATAVNSNNTESAYSSETTAVIP